MTNLSASELTKLTSMIDGQPRGRLASSLKTYDRLKATLAKAIGGEAKAAKVLEQALICETYGGAEAVIKRHLPKSADQPAADQPEASRKETASATKAPGKRAATLEAAQRGEMPTAPDFSAETHKRFRAKLAEVVAAAEAGDIAALQAFDIKPISSSPKAIAKYRDLAVIALEARRASA